MPRQMVIFISVSRRWRKGNSRLSPLLVVKLFTAFHCLLSVAVGILAALILLGQRRLWAATVDCHDCQTATTA